MVLINKPARLFDLENIRQIKYFVVPLVIFLLFAYSTYFLFDKETIRQILLVREDGLYEYLTAIFFFLAAAFFLISYVSNKNKWLMLLAIVMLFGVGEEMSWGQRVFGFDTPDMIMEHNVQLEFTLHNIEIFNGHTFEREEKRGFAKLLTINFLYKLFWLGYGVALPICFAYFLPISWLAEKIRLPVPPLSIGIFFLVNWLIFKITLTISLLENEEGLYRFTEILEAGASLVFMTIGLFFLKNGPTTYIGESTREPVAATDIRLSSVE